MTNNCAEDLERTSFKTWAIKRYRYWQQLGVTALSDNEKSQLQLVECSYPFMFRELGRYRGYCDDSFTYDDLQAAGNEGLLEAASRFDGSKGASFLTYAKYWIKVKVQEAVSENQPLAGLDSTRAARKLKGQKAALAWRLAAANDKDREREEIARENGLDVDDIAAVELALNCQQVTVQNNDAEEDLAFDEAISNLVVSPYNSEFDTQLQAANRDLEERERVIMARAITNLGEPAKTIILNLLREEEDRLSAVEMARRLGCSKQWFYHLQDEATANLQKICRQQINDKASSF